LAPWRLGGQFIAVSSAALRLCVEVPVSGGDSGRRFEQPGPEYSQFLWITVWVTPPRAGTNREITGSRLDCTFFQQEPAFASLSLKKRWVMGDG
jgi:hypothetical protein